MQQASLKHTSMKALVFTTLFVTLFSLSATAGLDSYTIYLNNKLVLKQAVNEPLNLQGLQLDKANANDQLVIYYSECHAPNKIGKGRRIAIKDDQGNIVKEWKFADVSGTDKGMLIPVKELLELKKALNVKFMLVYVASQLPQGQKLTGLQFG